MGSVLPLKIKDSEDWVMSSCGLQLCPESIQGASTPGVVGRGSSCQRI